MANDATKRGICLISLADHWQMSFQNPRNWEWALNAGDWANAAKRAGYDLGRPMCQGMDASSGVSHGTWGSNTSSYGGVLIERKKNPVNLAKVLQKCRIQWFEGFWTSASGGDVFQLKIWWYLSSYVSLSYLWTGPTTYDSSKTLRGYSCKSRSQKVEKTPRTTQHPTPSPGQKACLLHICPSTITSRESILSHRGANFFYAPKNPPKVGGNVETGDWMHWNFGF